jgi:hypothetical protein
MNMEQLVEKKLEGEAEVFGENLPHSHFAYRESHMTWPRIETGLQR